MIKNMKRDNFEIDNFLRPDLSEDRKVEKELNFAQALGVSVLLFVVSYALLFLYLLVTAPK